jgi:Zn-dependent peptidase ImmA (M78 family)
MPHLLFQLAEDNDIAIEYVNFTHTNIDAMYIDIPGCYPVIILSKKLFDNRSSLRSVLAHELGHYFTTTKSTIELSAKSEKVYLSYRDRIEMSRAEYRAWRWAANYLIPTNTLEEIYSEDFCEPWQLAEFFDVDESLVEVKLDIIKRSGTNWILSMN